MLAEGCIRLGLIENEEEIGTYYMHSVSHHLGIDVHDVNTLENDKLLPGMVISDEPGLYIDEWEIGIRIEDDLSDYGGRMRSPFGADYPRPG